MNRLLNTLRGLRERPAARPTPAPSVKAEPALPGFDSRVEVLYEHAQQAAAYEDELNERMNEAQANLDRLQAMVEAALDNGQDRQAFELVRVAARLRPQRDLLAAELQAFASVADELIRRVALLMDNIEEARRYARDGAASPAATEALDRAMIRLVRYFVLLDRVASNRRRELPDRLAERVMWVLDDRDLDMELARYVLSRRRALNAGERRQKPG